MQPLNVSLRRHIQCFLIFLLHTRKWLTVNCEHQEVCNNREFIVKCGENEAILIEKATFGRMAIGKCVHTDFGYIGCKNDVLSLADRWCSGLRHCTVVVPNDDLEKANTACSADLNSYLDVDYSCVPVTFPGRPCASRSPIKVHKGLGHISSQVTAETGCGSTKAPWVIEAQSGQTVDLSLIDFAALDRQEQSLYTSCHQLYGFIIERDLGVNLTMCGGTERKRHLYKSKTNKVEIHLLSRANDPSRFFVQYTLMGCADLTPPAHAWYKRDGNTAVIGCKSNSKIWHLTCNGNTWDGVVGNCTETSTVKEGAIGSLVISFSTVIILTCVICGAVLLIIIVIVSGIVYVRKQSIKHELKLRTEYGFSSEATYYTMKPGYGASTIRSGHVERAPECQTLIRLGDKVTMDTNTSQASGTANTAMKPVVVPHLNAMDQSSSDGILM